MVCHDFIYSTMISVSGNRNPCGSPGSHHPHTFCHPMPGRQSRYGYRSLPASDLHDPCSSTGAHSTLYRLQCCTGQIHTERRWPIVNMCLSLRIIHMHSCPCVRTCSEGNYYGTSYLIFDHVTSVPIPRPERETLTWQCVIA